MAQGVWLGVIVGAVVAAGASRALADCNCIDDGQCAYQTCCYQAGTCMPTARNEYKRCATQGDPGGFACAPAEACEGDPCDAPE